MTATLKPLSDQVLVITGASSGIGLATAREAAKAGAKLVLMARNEQALREIAGDMTQAGTQVAFVAGDVARREDHERAAEAALTQFGRIDTWVNNAGVGIWGRLDEVSDEDHRQLFETNFWGVVYGSTVALKHLRQKGGAIINLGSVASDMAFPVQGMYCASKHAIKGFTDALRIEIEESGAPISVTLIKPTSINTPFPSHARNYFDQEPKLPPPVYEPEEVAYAILHAAAKPVRDINVGGSGKMLTAFAAHAPRAMDWLMEKAGTAQQLGDEPARHRDGILMRPGKDGETRGDQAGFVRRTSVYTCAALHPAVTATVLAVVAVAVGRAVAGPRRSPPS